MKPINKPTQSRQELEALIADVLEGRLDSETLETLRRSLEDHPDLKSDWETLDPLEPLQEHQMMAALDQAFPEHTYEDPSFEASLRNSWQKQTSGQDLYHFTYILFKRYALAASLTILGGLSLLQLQSNSQTERSSELSQAELTQVELTQEEISQSEISEFLYGSDESLSTSYYASLFDADLDSEGATSIGSSGNTGAGTSGSGNAGTGNPGVGKPTTGNPTNTSNTDKN